MGTMVVRCRILIFLFLASCGGYQIANIAPLLVELDRDLLFDPQAEEFRPTAKLVFLIDNSSSMADEQELLSQGISSTFGQLKGYNLDILLLTTTSNDVAESKDTTVLRINRSLRIGAGEAQPLANEAGAVLNPNLVQEDYVVQRKYGLKNIMEGQAPLQLRSNMTDGEIDELKSRLMTKIQAIGALGSDDETGICSILRLLNEKEGDDYLLRKGDRVALVVISDDDDYTKNSECTAAESQLFKWVAPVASTQTVIVDPAAASFYKYATTWGDASKYQLNITYTDSVNPNPYWNIALSWTNEEYINLTYNYKNEEIFDGQPRIVTNVITQRFDFKSEDVGNPPVVNSQTNCTPALMEWAATRPKLGSDQVITSCKYQISTQSKTLNLTTALDGMAMPTSITACPAATVADVNAKKATYPSLFVANERYISCNYYYRAATLLAQTNYFSTLPADVVYNGGTLNCPTGVSALRSWAENTLTSGRVYSGCSLRIRGASKSCDFNDLPANVAANQCTSEGLKALVPTRTSSCTALQLQNLINYACTRSPYGSVTTMSAPRFAAEAPTKTTLAAALGERLEGITLPSTGDEGTNLVSYLKKSHTELFGEKGFFFSAIVKPVDTTGCPGLLAGGGLRYRDLATQLSNAGYIHSICAASYAPALDNMSNFIVRTLNNSYQVSIKDSEAIIGVKIIRDSNEIDLKEVEDYQALGGTLEFDNDVLELGDKIQLRIRNRFNVKRDGF
jgi:hypothetical protein